MTTHEHVIMNGIQIDKEMAPIIKELWNAGIDTQFCCEEISPGVAHIVFGHTDVALAFVNKTVEVINSVAPAMVFSVDIRMCPMPGEVGRWSVEWNNGYTELIAEIWENGTFEMCDCEGCSLDLSDSPSCEDCN